METETDIETEAEAETHAETQAEIYAETVAATETEVETETDNVRAVTSQPHSDKGGAFYKINCCPVGQLFV